MNVLFDGLERLKVTVVLKIWVMGQQVDGVRKHVVRQHRKHLRCNTNMQILYMCIRFVSDKFVLLKYLVLACELVRNTYY